MDTRPKPIPIEECPTDPHRVPRSTPKAYVAGWSALIGFWAALLLVLGGGTAVLQYLGPLGPTAEAAARPSRTERPSRLPRTAVATHQPEAPAVPARRPPPTDAAQGTDAGDAAAGPEAAPAANTALDRLAAAPALSRGPDETPEAAALHAEPSAAPRSVLPALPATQPASEDALRAGLWVAGQNRQASARSDGPAAVDGPPAALPPTIPTDAPALARGTPTGIRAGPAPEPDPPRGEVSPPPEPTPLAAQHASTAAPILDDAGGAPDEAQAEDAYQAGLRTGAGVAGKTLRSAEHEPVIDAGPLYDHRRGPADFYGPRHRLLDLGEAASTSGQGGEAQSAPAMAENPRPVPLPASGTAEVGAASGSGSASALIDAGAEAALGTGAVASAGGGRPAVRSAAAAAPRSVHAPATESGAKRSGRGGQVAEPTPGRQAAGAGQSLGSASDERCRAVLIRAQLGEEISDADRAYLRGGCRARF
jgi:hypothetical protein